MNTIARITNMPATTSALSATPVAPARSTTTTNATYRITASPSWATISINNATVREPSRAIRMSNSTASPLTSRSLPVEGGSVVTRTPYSVRVDLDAYVAEHAAQWRRLEQLARRRRLRPAEADELIGLYQRAATHLSVIRSRSPDPALVARLSRIVL